MLKLGKAAFEDDPRDLKMVDFVDLPRISVPDDFGHDTQIGPREWGMLGNDEVGDCVFAGAGHETMILTAQGSGSPTDFSTVNTLADYSAVTGYVPGRPATDQGTIVREAMRFRRKHGVLDANGERHKIGAYLRLDVTDLEQLYVATYLFSAVGIGIEFPRSAMQQFNRHEPWDVVPDSPIESGHYIPSVARPLTIVTWAAEHSMTEAFYERYADEAWAFVSREMLDPETGRSPEGLKLGQLIKALDQTARL